MSLRHLPRPMSGDEGANALTGTWLDPLAAVPGKVNRALAVIDGLFTCSWHFAELRTNGRWYDLRSGEQFAPTHWMPLPKAPSELEDAQ